MNDNERKFKTPTFAEAIFPIVFMVFILGVGKGILDWPTEFCLLLAATVAGIIAIARLGYKFSDLEKYITEKIAAVISPILIVLFVGFMVGAWCFSGTMPMLVYYGMKFIKPELFLLITFVATSVLAFVAGSWGAAASIGVALMGVGSGFGISPAMTAAAIVTGGYLAGKLSPLSDSTQLAAAVTKVPIYDHIQYMMWTTVPSALLAMGYFLFLGMSHSTGGG